MKLEGTVEHVIYENADSGYAVFEVDAGGTDVVVAGNVGGVDNGMSVTVYGHMVNHPSYGEQFRAETIEARLPEDRTACPAACCPISGRPPLKKSWQNSAMIR